jgi:NADPH:quinone reductase-like Zn-dependent oxidoreductase
MGARVAVTSSSDEKLKRAPSLGADYVVNYRQHADWAARVADSMDGRGVDSVIEVGSPATLSQSIQARRAGGHIALIGALTGAGVAYPAFITV